MRKGFSLPELMVSLGILTLLFSIATFSLLKSQRSFARAAFFDTLLTDIRDQQNKAMAQNTLGETESSDYGIYLASDYYILFKGSAYTADDPQNFQVGMDPGLQITGITLPSSSIVFGSGSGEMVGFVPGSSGFNIDDLTSNVVTAVQLNRYGIPLE